MRIGVEADAARIHKQRSAGRVVELVGVSMDMDMDVPDSKDRFPALARVGNDSPHARWSIYFISIHGS